MWNDGGKNDGGKMDCMIKPMVTSRIHRRQTHESETQTSLIRQWQLLEWLSSEPEGMTVSDAAEATGVSLRTIRRDLTLLRRIGFDLEETEKNVPDTLIWLGLRRQIRGSAACEQSGLGHAARNVLHPGLGRSGCTQKRGSAPFPRPSGCTTSGFASE